METLHVKAHWDAKASVWWAESDDIPGVVAEAATYEELVEDLRQIIPEMLQMNMPHLKTKVLVKLYADKVEDLCFA